MPQSNQLRTLALVAAILCAPRMSFHGLAVAAETADTLMLTVSNIAAARDAILHLRVGAQNQVQLRHGERTLIGVPGSSGLQYFSGDIEQGQGGWIAMPLEGVREIAFRLACPPASKPAWQAVTYSHNFLPNSVGVTMVPIAAGKFRMGSRLAPGQVASRFQSDREDEKDFRNEHPRREVVISKPFYISRHEIANRQFAMFIDATKYQTDAERLKSGGGTADPSHGHANVADSAGATWKDAADEWTREAKKAKEGDWKGVADDVPAVNVSWNDAVAFCKWLSEHEKRTYRLPSEAEWEYVCRAGTSTEYWVGESPALLRWAGNVPDRSLAEATKLTYVSLPTNDHYPGAAPVESFESNPFGVFDTHGNVWEWCRDSFDANYYARAPGRDPLNLARAEFRVIRGGCFL